MSTTRITSDDGRLEIIVSADGKRQTILAASGDLWSNALEGFVEHGGQRIWPERADGYTYTELAEGS